VYAFWEPVSKRVTNILLPSEERPVPLITLKKEHHRLIVPAEGELAGLETVAVSTPRVRSGGLKISWLVEEGLIVQAGQVVVRFDDSDAQLSLEENQNEFDTFRYQIQQNEDNSEGEMLSLEMDQEAAENELMYSRGQIRRDEDIFSRWEIQESLMSAALAEFKKGNLETKVELQSGLSSSDLKILGIEKSKVEAEIELANERLSSLSVIAPIDGVLIYERFRSERLEVGAEVWPGQPLAKIAKMNQFRGIIQVSEKNITGLESRSSAEVRLTAFPEMALTGKVKQIARIAEQLDREDPRKYFECDLLLDASVDLMTDLKPGMKFRAEIVIGDWEEAFLLPKSAVFRRDSTWFVFVKSGEEYIEKEVQVLASDHGFYLLEGLEEGKQVCLQHPFEDEKLVLPDFNAPPAAVRRQRFVMIG
ncbi:MAG TPA: efflux RND transporter periplasmic adaptor subunit, partial [Acidobacteriota bacterium]|nr:efflux RND transporter periplasmic adaptor subunit [Acidobacteriota bacterium]